MSITAPPAPKRTLVDLKPDKWYSELALHKVPSTYLLGSFFVSYLILAISWLETDTAWLAFGLALLPWGIIVFIEVEWTYKHFGWLALGFMMAVVQAIHYSEHCIEMIQYHVFGDPLAESVAIFTKFNVEWVHFGGDTFLTIGTLLLIWKFPRNPWFYIAFPLQLAHQAEHNFLWFTYQFLGADPGMPGVLGKNGLAGENGLLGLPRVDLHWIYNTLYTIPFVIGLIWQCKRTYDQALVEAFPEVAQADLLKASKHMATFQYARARRSRHPVTTSRASTSSRRASRSCPSATPTGTRSRSPASTRASTSARSHCSYPVRSTRRPSARCRACACSRWTRRRSTTSCRRRAPPSTPWRRSPSSAWAQGRRRPPPAPAAG